MPIWSAFFAYPSSIAEVCDAIAGAAALLKPRTSYELHTWVENDISGRPLTDPIFERIEQCDFLIADVTALNFNVTFEIGYAIGLGKRVHLVRDLNFSRDADLAAKVGIFDTLGFESYADQASLLALILKMTGERPIPLRANRTHLAPIYLVQTPSSSQAMLAIISRIKKTRLTFSSFIPAEEIRLAAGRTIESVSGCLGVVVPLMASSSRGEKTLAELAQQYDVHPNQITAWKAQAMEGVAGIFGSGNAGLEATPAVDVKVLHAKIGELTLEVDFLAGALGKAGLLSAKR